MNKKGFSLIELIVTIGCLGIVLGIAATLMVNLAKMRQELLANETLGFTAIELRNSLNSPYLCDNAISNINTINPQASDTSFDSNGNLNASGGQEVQIQLNSGTLAAGQLTSDSTLRIASLKLYDAELYADTPTESIYQANVVGQFEFNSSILKSRSLPPNKMASLLFSVNKNTNTVENCHWPHREGIDISRILCENIGGSFDAGTQQCDAIPNLCQNLGGTMNNGACQLTREPASGPPPATNSCGTTGVDLSRLTSHGGTACYYSCSGNQVTYFETGYGPSAAASLCAVVFHFSGVR